MVPQIEFYHLLRLERLVEMITDKPRALRILFIRILQIVAILDQYIIRVVIVQVNKYLMLNCLNFWSDLFS